MVAGTGSVVVATAVGGVREGEVARTPVGSEPLQDVGAPDRVEAGLVSQVR